MDTLRIGGAAALICSAFALADSSVAVAAGGVHAFHGHSHGLRGFYGGLYPYSLFGYPGSVYGGYYPYSIYDDNGPDCDFVWVKRAVKHKAVGRGIWTCS